MAKSAEGTRQERLRALLDLAKLPSDSLAQLDFAFVHESAARESAILSNERLEFLGDAILGYAVARWLFQEFPDEDEGSLSRRKAAMVSGSALAQTAHRLGFSEIVRLGTGERLAGGANRPSILAGAFEAFVAAIFLEHGLEAARSFIEEQHIRSFDQSRAAQSDPKSQLQELLQAQAEPVPQYSETAEGPPHARTFTSTVTIRGKIVGKGSGPSKKSAQQDAAAQALRTLESEVDEA